MKNISGIYEKNHLDFDNLSILFDNLKACLGLERKLAVAIGFDFVSKSKSKYEFEFDFKLSKIIGKLSKYK